MIIFIDKNLEKLSSVASLHLCCFNFILDLFYVTVLIGLDHCPMSALNSRRGVMHWPHCFLLEMVLWMGNLFLSVPLNVLYFSVYCNYKLWFLIWVMSYNFTNE